MISDIKSTGSISVEHKRAHSLCDIQHHKKSVDLTDVNLFIYSDNSPIMRVPKRELRKNKTNKINKLKILLNKRLKMLIVSKKSHDYLYSFYNKLYMFITVMLVFSASGSFVVDFLYEDKHNSNTTKVLYLFFEVMSLILIGVLTKTPITEKLHGHDRCKYMVNELIQDIEFFIAKDINNRKTYNDNLSIYEEKIKSYKSNETYIPAWVKHKHIHGVKINEN